jgi:hypothetical protein
MERPWRTTKLVCVLSWGLPSWLAPESQGLTTRGTSFVYKVKIRAVVDLLHYGVATNAQ